MGSSMCGMPAETGRRWVPREKEAGPSPQQSAVRAAHSSGRALGPWAWDLGPRGLGASGPWDDCLGVGARRGGAKPPPWPLVIAACGMRQAAVIGLHVAAKAPSGKKTKTEMLWGAIRRYCHDRPQQRPSTLVSQREPGKTDGLP
jgi:hypothetical protein